MRGDAGKIGLIVTRNISNKVGWICRKFKIVLSIRLVQFSRVNLEIYMQMIDSTIR